MKYEAIPVDLATVARLRKVRQSVGRPVRFRDQMHQIPIQLSSFVCSGAVRCFCGDVKKVKGGVP